MVGRAQANDSLAPVTVIVPRGSLRLSLRRSLAAEGFVRTTKEGGTNLQKGIANVRFITFLDLIEELGSPVLHAAGRLRATQAVIYGAVCSVLSETQGTLFSSVRDHPSSARALCETYQELHGASQEVLAILANQSARAREVIALVKMIDERLQDWYGESDLVSSALNTLKDLDVSIAMDESKKIISLLESFGHLIFFLPIDLSSNGENLLINLGKRVPLEIVIGVTGDPVADQTARRLAIRFGTEETVIESAFLQRVQNGHRVISAPSADAEVLHTVRSVMALQKDGTSLEKVAIAYARGSHYPRIVREALLRSSIPFNGVGIQSLANTVVGRVLLGAFGLLESDWHRSEVMAWLSTGPILDRGREISLTMWDRISHEAGVVSGLTSWRTQLNTFQNTLNTKIRLLGGAEDAEVQPYEVLTKRLLLDCDELNSFISRLASRFQSVPNSWEGWVNWSRQFIHDFLGGPEETASWPDAEVAALDALNDLLSELKALDAIYPLPSIAVFRSILTSELSRPAPQVTRFGHGVLLCSVDDLLGLDLDAVFIVGMNEGTFPARRNEDVLIKDHERSADGVVDEVPLRCGHSGDLKRNYLAGLAAAKFRTLSYSRNDQRQGRELRPSRWVLETLRELTGRVETPLNRDLEDLGAIDSFVFIPSFTAVVQGEGEPASLLDYDLRGLLRWTLKGHRVSSHFLTGIDDVLSLGLVCKSDRASSRFTRFDGMTKLVTRTWSKTGPGLEASGIKVSDDPFRDGLNQKDSYGDAYSATRLEAYARCPRRYLFEKVLGVVALTQDRSRNEMRTIDPAVRGEIIHKVLERFFRYELEKPIEKRIQPEESWGDDAKKTILEIADHIFEEFISRVSLGHAVFLELEKLTIRRDLVKFLGVDSSFRCRELSQPVDVEMRFGGADSPLDLNIVEPDPEDKDSSLPELTSTSISFKGRVDRIDKTRDGTIIVLDYKSGSSFGLEGISGDPDSIGTKLQLPVYALAAMEKYGKAPVKAIYWMVTTKGNFEQIGYLVTDEHLRRFRQALSGILRGIEAGAFPAHPGEKTRGSFTNCEFCPFDAICPPDRLRAWERKRSDSALRGYAELTKS